VKISEPAADLAAAAALVSSLTGAVLPQHMVFFGEVGLSGAIRPAPHANLRLKEAAKLGFSTAAAPPGLQDGDPASRSAGIALRPIRQIGEAVAEIAALSRAGTGPRQCPPARQPSQAAG
jgi:DNA repair protein RadA/Sms